MTVWGLLADWTVQVSAAITAGAAGTVAYEAHRARRAIERNSERSLKNKRRSLGNRRWLRRFGARLLPTEEYRPPHRYDPDENEARPDGGRRDG